MTQRKDRDWTPDDTAKEEDVAENCQRWRPVGVELYDDDDHHTTTKDRTPVTKRHQDTNLTLRSQPAGGPQQQSATPLTTPWFRFVQAGSVQNADCTTTAVTWERQSWASCRCMHTGVTGPSCSLPLASSPALPVSPTSRFMLIPLLYLTLCLLIAVTVQEMCESSRWTSWTPRP